MSVLPKSIQNLINEFAKLPGIGPKSASRLTFYLLKQPNLDLQSFAGAVSNLLTDLRYCSRCYNMAETDPCKICSDPKRNQQLICVVEDPLDVVALDQIADFNGVYHVLGGVISPLDGVGPENLKIAQLLARLQGPDPKEVILTTNPSMEGEATAILPNSSETPNLPMSKSRALRADYPPARIWNTRTSTPCPKP
jgi:recombination protein RecR